MASYYDLERLGYYGTSPETAAKSSSDLSKGEVKLYRTTHLSINAHS